MDLQSKLLRILKSTHNPSLYLIVTILVRDDRGKDIQQALKQLGATLDIDGVVGYHTIKAILSVDEDEFAEKLLNIADSHVYDSETYVANYDKVKPKDRIMNYLARFEGTTLHWNKTETNLTTPYGIYRKSFPNATIFKYIDALCVKYIGHTITKRDLKALSKFNNSVTIKERRRIKDMAWDFYLNNFMNPTVTDMLDGKEGMSFFSISVNGGRSRGIKSIYSAIKMKLKSFVTDEMLLRLRKIKDRNISINNGMLDYMLNFYKYLIQKKPVKFSRYKRGWFDRIRQLR